MYVGLGDVNKATAKNVTLVYSRAKAKSFKARPKPSRFAILSEILPT